VEGKRGCGCKGNGLKTAGLSYLFTRDKLTNWTMVTDPAIINDIAIVTEFEGESDILLG